MSDVCTEDRFLGDVKEHEMIVIRDEGVNRHIRFKRLGTSCYYFDLITWPGCLCYTGDMGTYVFQRTEDMFEFFRMDRKHLRAGKRLGINIGYWTEKLIAVDGNRGGGKVKVFDNDKFARVINGYRVRWMRDAKESGLLDKDGRRELWEAVDSDVMTALDEEGEGAIGAAYRFSHRHYASGAVWQFDDLFENDFTEYTHSIIWCLYALAWGVAKYDLSKVEVVP